MSEILHKLERRYAKLWLSISKYDTWIHILDTVNFNKSWFNIILHYKWLIIPQLTIVIIVRVLISLSPIIIGNIVESRDISLLVTYIGGCVLSLIVAYPTDYLYNAGLISSAQSIIQSSNRFLLSVDPIHHTLKKSGQIINKVSRAASAIEGFIDIVVYNFVNIIIGYVSLTIAFSQYSGFLASIALMMVLTLLVIQSSLKIFETRSFEDVIIQSGDNTNTVQHENLQQTQFIRTLFASSQRLNELKKRSHYEAHTVSTKYMIGAFHFDSMYILYFIFLGILSFFVLEEVETGNISTTAGTALLITFVLNTREISGFGDILRNFSRHITHLNDLFSFLSQYGTQNFPVFEKEEQKESSTLNKSTTKKFIELSVKNLHYSYPLGHNVFCGHNISLQKMLGVENAKGLYGIIGPSGSGKTTLMGILGGQLKPDCGTVKINNIDIYSITETQRQCLIALQPQTASALRGTLKYNLLFGLPETFEIKDDSLVIILHRVGLWNLFESHQGLDTIIGEGGVNLSGGQRQRLNFANLYIRSRHYQPYLVLIDEPTSSLDEVSEFSVTSMIEELSKDMLTLVIAHRLKTLESACGLLDTSLVKSTKNLEFYAKNELLNVSEYYRDLSSGKYSQETFV